jgi:transglutaminase-like putative cysteine protease
MMEVITVISITKIVVIVLVALLCISGWSTYGEYEKKVSESEKGPPIEEETLNLKSQIEEIESLIRQVEEEISKFDPLILEEKKKREELQGEIDALIMKKSQLEEQIEEKREPERDPRVMITLNDPVVIAKVKEITRGLATTRQKQEALFKYVRQEIDYVTEGNPREYSYPKSFLEYKFEFWQLPRETIAWGSGDCEDQAILLCTMMRIAGVPASDVRVCLGLMYVGGVIVGGHAWCEFKYGTTWYVLESTCYDCGFIERRDYYDLYSPEVWGWFNDEEYE